MPKPKSKNALSWANAVKMWNMHKKIYDPTHVYAMPRKGTAEYDDAKHVQVHGALPAHLHKKAPFPAAALEQLRRHEKESEARREITKREKVINKIEQLSPTLRIEEAEEPAPKIIVPALPARLEKKEEETKEDKIKKIKAEIKAKNSLETRSAAAKENKGKGVSAAYRKHHAAEQKKLEIQIAALEQELKKLESSNKKPARAKIIAAILEEAQRRKKERDEPKPIVLSTSKEEKDEKKKDNMEKSVKKDNTFVRIKHSTFMHSRTDKYLVKRFRYDNDTAVKVTESQHKILMKLVDCISKYLDNEKKIHEVSLLWFRSTMQDEEWMNAIRSNMSDSDLEKLTDKLIKQYEEGKISYSPYSGTDSTKK